MVEIAPSILAADFECLEEEIKSIENLGIDWIHVDVMDGKFVPNQTPGLVMMERAKSATNKPLDVHLMVEKPEKWIEPFGEAARITFHVEAMEKSKIETLIQEIKKQGKKVGISIKPNTPVEEIKPYLSSVDMVLVMTVEPGFGGQKLIPETVDKIRQIRKLAPQIAIEVDGGINIETAPLVKEAGATILVVGTAIFKAENRKVVMERLKE